MLPNQLSPAKKVILLQLSSAAAEQVFSLLNSSFGHYQFVEASFILQTILVFKIETYRAVFKTDFEGRLYTNIIGA